MVHQTGYPLVAKPDIGVGAAKTFKLHNKNELEAFFSFKPDVDYILEEFIEGDIITFDGLTDRDGYLVRSPERDEILDMAKFIQALA